MKSEPNKDDAMTDTTPTTETGTETAAAPMTPTEMGRAIAALKRRVTGECAVCGKPVEGVVKYGTIARRYCSERCRKAAYRARVKLRDAAEAEAETAGVEAETYRETPEAE